MPMPDLIYIHMYIFGFILFLTPVLSQLTFVASQTWKLAKIILLFHTCVRAHTEMMLSVQMGGTHAFYLYFLDKEKWDVRNASPHF